MDSPEVALGVCCTLIPVGIVAIIAWLARNKAEQAFKQADEATRQVKVLQQQLVLMRLALNKFTSGSEVLPSLVNEAPTFIAPPAPTPVAPTPEQPFLPEAPEPVVALPPPPTPPMQPTLPPRAPPPPPRPPIEWEKWIGIRGAAVLGGIVFAMAGVYLFRYSVQQGWISPVIRVAAAMLAGVGALVAGQRLRQKYTVTAQALSGGGIVVLYAATWAARAMYDLIPSALAFVLMILITAVAGVLAVRQNNRLVAWLGLVGGFATPLLLSTGQNAPIPLFAYVLLLDVGVLFVAMKTKWKSITVLALIGTTLLELGWIFTRMEADQAWLAFGVLALFTVLFTITTLRSEGEPSKGTRWLLGSALFVPMLALAYFASNADVHVPQWPTAAFLAVLTAGVGFIHRRSARSEASLLMTASIASLFVLALSALTRHEGIELQWILVGSTLLVGLASVVNVLLPQSDERRAEGLNPVRIFIAGATVVLLIGSLRTPNGTSHLPFNIGLGVLTLVQAWLMRGLKDTGWQSLAGVMPAAWLALDMMLTSGHAYDDALITFGPVVVLAALLLAMSLRLSVERVLIAFVISSASWCVLLSEISPRQPLQVLASMALLTTLGLAATVRGSRPVGALVLVILYGIRLGAPLHATEGTLVPWAAVLVAGFIAALVFHFMLVLAPTRFHANRWGPVSAGLVLPVAFPGLLLAWRASFGTSMQGALPVLLAIISLGTATWARSNRPALKDRGVMWLLASAATLVAIAVPLQLENQWVTISWALMGVAYLVLWKRFDSRGLKWLAVTLLSIVSIRLLINDEVLDYGHSGGVPILNWLTYTYLIPAACLVGAGWLLNPLEVARARGWETPLYALKIPLAASSSFISAALVVFAWVTLSVFDFYAPTANLSLTLDRLPARDLTLSVSWIIYAVGLLAVGMWRNARSLRWMSLVFLLASIGKVFLYDLGELKDLYRVASLMGLAISLIGVSLAYQRFVFRRSEERPS